MHNQHSPHIDQATVDRWQADGVVLLKGVFTPWVERLAEGVTALMASPSEYGHARTVIPKDGSPPFFQDYCNWARIPAFSEFVFQSAAAEIAAALMQSQTAKFFHEHTLVKPAGGSTVTPWHHDQPYYCVSGRQNVSFWIPLDPVAEATSLRCIRGSHRWEAEYSPTRFNGTKLYEHTRFSALPDIDAHEDEYDIVSWALEPGDAVAFHFRTVHGARGNPGARARRVFSARWVGDDAAFADRGGVTSPPFPELTLKRLPLAPLAGVRVRVRMRFAPVNPSDLIPVTGAYRHRTRLPAVAGYEGLGEVVAAPYGSRLAAGQRVLPLRGGGTWQRFIDLDETWLVPVPPAVDDLLAARGYINPLTAMLMLKRWPVAGKHLVLTAASSSCASLLGQWALAMGARSVSGIIRSPQHRARLEQAGIYPILDTDRALMEKVSQHSDLVFDAVGGELANTLLSVLPGSSTLISYGLLSGRPLTQTRGSATVRKFHLREALPTLSVAAWRAAFDEIWQRLPTTSQPPAQRIALNDWRAAIAAAGQPGRGGKILLDFTAG